MRRFFSFLIHPIVISLFGLILLSLLIWFGGPLVKFGEGNSAPLGSATARLIAIMILVLIWGLNNLRIQLQNNKHNRDHNTHRNHKSTDKIKRSSHETSHQESTPKSKATMTTNLRRDSLSTNMQDKTSKSTNNLRFTNYDLRI